MKKVLENADPSWASKRILGSLSSGEGLIKYMKHLKGENPSAKDLLVNYANEVKRSPDDLETVRFLVEAMNSVVDDEGHVQHGSLNGRGMVVQEEFARTLKVMSRENNTLSAILREAFDSSVMTNATVKPDFVDGVHLSVIAHITEEELLSMFNPIDVANGLGNRFMFTMTTRRQSVPRGGRVPDDEMSPLTSELREAVKWAQSEREIDFTEEVADYWDEVVYEPLTDSAPGLVDKLLDRGRTHVRRIALLYSVLDRSSSTEMEHLEAALAVWDYCAASAKYLFGGEGSTGDPDLDLVMQALQESESGKLSRTQITSEVFKGNKGRYPTVKRRVEEVQKRAEELDLITIRRGKRKNDRGPIPQLWKLKE